MVGGPRAPGRQFPALLQSHEGTATLELRLLTAAATSRQQFCEGIAEGRRSFLGCCFCDIGLADGAFKNAVHYSQKCGGLIHLVT